MKLKSFKKVNTFITVTVLFVLVVVFNNSCQKATSMDSKPTSAIADPPILYTDIKPDLTLTCNTPGCSHVYNLDLNNDGKIDFGIEVFMVFVGKDPWCGLSNGPHSAFGVRITPLDSNSEIGGHLVTVTPGNLEYAYRLPANWTINDQSGYDTAVGRTAFLTVVSFYRSRNNTYCSSNKSGEWASAQDGYLGLKLKKGQNTYFGWVHLSDTVSSLSASFTLKDYAFNKVANQSILAGQTK